MKITSFLVVFLGGAFMNVLYAEINHAERDYQIRGFEWQSKNVIVPSSKVEVINLYGNIDIQGTDAKVSSVVATIQESKNTKNNAVIDIGEVDGVLKVEVKFPENHFQSNVNKKDRVDLGVIVPDNIFVKATTAHGRIKSKYLHSFLKATTDSGNIKLVTSKGVDISTRSGKTLVEWTDTKWVKDNFIRSQSGNITAKLSPASQIVVKAVSSGEISYQDVHGELRKKNKKMDLAFGNAHTKLNIVSDNGNIQLIAMKPETISGAVVKPSISDQNLRQLPKPKEWKPGDPIQEISKRTHKKSDPTKR